MRSLAIAAGIALLLSSVVAGEVAGHDGSVGPSRDLAIRDVGVVGGGGYATYLSDGVIAFAGDVVPGVWPTEHPIYIHRIAEDETRNTGHVGLLVCFDDPIAVLRQHEVNHGDLNGDGDLLDWGHLALNVENGEGVRFAVGGRVNLWCASDGYISFLRDEPDEGVDINGDGDAHDTLGYVFDVASRTETSLGATTIIFAPMMFGRYVVWGCEVRGWDVCYREVGEVTVRSAGLYDLPMWIAGDEELLAFTSRLGAEVLGFFVFATGRLVVDAGIGVVSGVALAVSHGTIFSEYGYGHAKVATQFLYDVEIGRVTDLPRIGPYNVQLHGRTLVGNDHSGACVCPAGEPPPYPPDVLAYDIEAGTLWDTGLDGYLRHSIVSFDGDTIVADADERVVGTDVNGDGDLFDIVVMYATTGEFGPTQGPATDLSVRGYLMLLAVAGVAAIVIASRHVLG